MEFLVTQAVVTPPILTAGTDLLVQQTTAMAVTTPGKELLDVRNLTHTAESKFAVVTHKRGGFYGSPPLQRVSLWLENHVEISKNDNAQSVALGSVILAGVGGAIAHLGFGLLLLPAILCGAGVLATGLGALGLSHAIKGEAKLARDRAAENLVPLSAVDDMVQRFDRAPPGEKAVIGRMLSDWIHRMRQQRALSPEALDALERVAAENRQLPQANLHRAAILGQLVALLDGEGSVDQNTVASVASYVGELPKVDQLDMAKSVKGLLESSGRTISYDAKHALFQMVKSFTP